MKKILILIFSAMLMLVLPQTKTSAKTTKEWIHMDNKDDTTGSAIEKTNDGGFIVTGMLGRMLYLKKISPSGKEEWSNVFLEGLDGTDIKQTLDGGFIIVGQTKYQDDKVKVQSIVIKTDSKGNLEWEKILGGYNFDKHQSVLVTDDGYFIVGSGTDSKRTGASLLYLDLNGKIKWHKIVDKFNGKKITYASDAEVNDQNFTVLFVYEEKNISKTSIVKVSKDGELKLISNVVIGASSIVRTNDAGYVISGNNSSYRMQVLRVDKNGKTKWSKINYPKFSKSYTYGELSEITPTKDGGYLIGGTARTSGVMAQAYAFKIDHNGKFLWERTFLKVGSRVNEIVENSDGTFTVVGGYHNHAKDKLSLFVIKKK